MQETIFYTQKMQQLVKKDPVLDQQQQVIYPMASMSYKDSIFFQINTQMLDCTTQSAVRNFYGKFFCVCCRTKPIPSIPHSSVAVDTHSIRESRGEQLSGLPMPESEKSGHERRRGSHAGGVGVSFCRPVVHEQSCKTNEQLLLQVDNILERLLLKLLNR